MKSVLLFNPLSVGGKKYGLILRGPYTKKEIKQSIEEITQEKISITSLNRKEFRQFYLNFSLRGEERLREYWSLMKKELIKKDFNPESIGKIKENFIKKK